MFRRLYRKSKNRLEESTCGKEKYVSLDIYDPSNHVSHRYFFGPRKYLGCIIPEQLGSF